MSKPFQFKEFTVQQDKTAMKIGTDSVLLGAWCSVNFYPDSILDIGAGTGIISLMLAQRSDAMTIDAVEIEENAYEQCTENFENSDWSDRLYCYHASFVEFATKIEKEGEKYDVIISNPPFYTDEYQIENEARNKARFSEALPFDILIKSTVTILSKRGKFSVIIPFSEEENFINLANQNNLFLNRICRVQGNETSKKIRSIIEFSFTKKTVKEGVIIIEKARHQYTEEYIALTKNFYLKM